MRTHHLIDRRTPSSLRPTLRLAAGLAIVTAVAGLTPAGAAECAAGVSCSSTPPALIELGTGSAPPATSSPYASEPAPSASAPAPLPFAMQKSDSSVTMRTGLSDVGAYQQRELQRKIDGIKGSLPANMRLPKPATAAKPDLDVWTRVEANGLADDANSRLKTSAGADYKLGSAARTGVAVERSEPTAASAASRSVQDDKVSGYVALQAVPGLSVDTRAQWEARQTRAGESEKGSLSVAPRLGHRFAIDGGNTLEPFVTMKRELDLGSSLATSSVAATDSAGAGVTLAKPDAYSLGVSTTVDGIDRAEPASVSSKLQLKVPLH